MEVEAKTKTVQGLNLDDIKKRQGLAILALYREWLKNPPSLSIDEFFLKFESGKMRFSNQGSTADDKAYAFTISAEIPQIVRIPHPLAGSIQYFTNEDGSPVLQKNAKTGEYERIEVPSSALPDTIIEVPTTTFRVVLLTESESAYGAKEKIISFYQRDKKIPFSPLVGKKHKMTRAELVQLLSASSDLSAEDRMNLENLSAKAQETYLSKKNNLCQYKAIYLLFLLTFCMEREINSVEQEAALTKVSTKKFEQIERESRIAHERFYRELELREKRKAENEKFFAIQREEYAKLQSRLLPTLLVQELYKEKKEELSREYAAKPSSPKPTPFNIYSAVAAELREKLEKAAEEITVVVMAGNQEELKTNILKVFGIITSAQTLVSQKMQNIGKGK